VASGDTIWARSANGATDVQVTSGAQPRLSMDGRYMVFHRRDASTVVNHQDVWVRDLAMGTETKVFANNDYVVGYGFTPDDAKLVFDYASEVDRANRDGTRQRRLFLYDGNDDAPDANPVDGRIVLHNGNSGLYVLPSDGSTRAKISGTQAGDYWPTWSPDGTWISFLRTTSTSANYYKVKPDGTGLTQLTFFPATTVSGASQADLGDRRVVAGLHPASRRRDRLRSGRPLRRRVRWQRRRHARLDGERPAPTTSGPSSPRRPR